MSGPFTLTIPDWNPTPLNKLLGHWARRHRLKRGDADLVMFYSRLQGIPAATGRRRVSLRVTLGPRQRAPDPDALWKSTLDALVRTGLLLNDDRFDVELGSVEFERGPARATAILLEDMPLAQGEARPDVVGGAEVSSAVSADERMAKGHGEKLSTKQEAVIAALLSEPTHAAAAAKAGISAATLQRWLRLPAFHSAYRRARRELVAGAIGRLQAATGLAVDTLLAVAKDGKRDGDRVRAAIALLDHALRGGADLADTEDGITPAAIEGTGDVVKLLAERLRQLDAAELPTGEKSRLTATLADALLRALGVDVLDKRLEALQGVLLGRKAKGR
ncbi:MAG TPA: hypothetical protein VEL76_33350 [Gemmataceae bacterium]|nr:hypothetical protein [Gemmataceae bacterium]